ncbi:MAG TPA: glycine--tRNA ligase subunit beta [Gammaproteobacteria bacterium]|nr:glycine--tRNA ligase subunit beta [Gammaproteobacteria bacterium]
MNTRDLLIEIGTEELPPRSLRKLSLSFQKGVIEGLRLMNLEHGESQCFATPRRLAVLVRDLQEKQQDKLVEKRGPALAAAFDDDGCPTRAATGFAKSCGVNIEDLERLETDKGTWLAFRTEQKGHDVQLIIPEIVKKSLECLPIPRRMRWGSSREQFVRPVHWVVLLFGNEVIATEILGIKSGRETRGHRFHHPDKMAISEPSAYESLLETGGHVIADFEIRSDAIKRQIRERARQVNGIAIIDENLLDEVTSMVEWPVAILGNFDRHFLDIPSEALISAMKSHQKYFHLVDKQGRLLPHFITISNIESKNPDRVREGNERVIRPRLADSEFFWQQDRKQKLADRIESLKKVIFQNKLGTLHMKVQRIIDLSGIIAAAIGHDTDNVRRSAELCKCDLMTNMVGEFPELQGIMGRYYAELDGEDDEVARAIEEHYTPRFAGDRLPETVAGQCVSLADKIDTLVGIFSIGQAPSGDKDPFALRRAALGIIRIIIEQNLTLDLDQIIKSAIKNYTFQKIPVDITNAPKLVYDFILGRLAVYYVSKGFDKDVIESVLCLKPSHLQDCDRRIRVVSDFRKMPESESLAAANKRIANILKKINFEIPETWNLMALEEQVEKNLADEINQLIPILDPLFDEQDYEAAMKKLASLRGSVDAFFDEVMVMSDDEKLRNNRLAMLNAIRNQFLRVADLSRLQ